MPGKLSKVKPILAISAVLIVGILLNGCGKRGSRFGNNPPTISITSYEGYDPALYHPNSQDSLNECTAPDSITLFQQKIYWHGEDRDGVVTGYAYRILDANGNPISTAGNDFIDADGSVTPQQVIDKGFGIGWVLHYQEGAENTLPLSDPKARRTIWSSQKFVVVNFPASDSLGNPLVEVSSIEVICVDNRGDVCAKKAFRRFTSSSAKPVCFLDTTKGNPEGAEVGTGIRLRFTLDDSDPYIQPTAWYYRFKVEKVFEGTDDNLANDVVKYTQPGNEWASTKNQVKINEFLLTKYTQYRLSTGQLVDLNITSDFDTPATYTRVIAEVIDQSGIISAPDTIYFKVKDGFHPGTLIYLLRTYALGTNHNIDYSDESTSEIWPYTFVNNKQLFASYLFKDKNNDYSVVNSSNLKIWIRWGWHGEYAQANTNGSYTTTDYPYDKKVDVLLNEGTLKNYFSEITHFDLRLDGEPYNYPPMRDSIVTDPGTLKKWLRVPVNSGLGQTVVLAHLASNTPDNPYHIFEVGCVDLQNEVDPTPEVIRFKVVEPVPKLAKNGVLILDDDPPQSIYSPGAHVDSLWTGYFTDHNITPVTIHYDSLTEIQHNIPTKRRVALSDMERFKLVVFHSENPVNASNFGYENDAITLYLKEGGNVLFSMTGQNTSGFFADQSQKTIITYFGTKMNTTQIGSITSATNPYFIKAKGRQIGTITYDSLLVQMPSFNPVVTSRQGLYSVTYFNGILEPGTDVMYKFGCKPVDFAVSPPSQANYNLLNDQPIGLRRYNTVGNIISKCYMLGFPLSYMNPGEASDFIGQILSEL